MRYIANSTGYLQEVSFGAMIECDGKSCTEYTGGVPSGYSSLADWATKEADKLYRWKIADGELTLDSNARELPPASFSIVVTEPGTDLDDFTTSGWYFFHNYTVTPNNIPPGVTNGWLHVLSEVGPGGATYKKQIFYRMGTPGVDDHQTYVRTISSGVTSWSSWTRYATEKDLGVLTKKKLWTNANLSNSFNAQTISLDLSSYDGVEIVFYADETTNVYQNTGFIPKGLNSAMWYITAISGHRLHREFTATDSGVSFITATNYSGNATADKICIPYIIYGVKGIS